MANKNVNNFVATYGPVAQQVSKEINVDPNVLLGQWGMESRWGQTEMAKKYHNLGGVKDFSGKGFEAVDNQTGSKDKYVKFEDPEVFGMYYANMIKQNFPKAVNTGPDVGAFTRGLQSGTKGSYFDVSVPQEEYEKSLTGALNAIPEDQQLPFTPTAKPATVDGSEGDMVVVPAPLASADSLPASDRSGASSGERFLAGAVGTGIGTLATGAQAYGAQNTAAAVRRAGLEEAARIAAQRSAGVIPPATGGLGEGLTSGEKWAAKTGYGKGAGTVQDVSSRFQRAVGKGPISSKMDKLWGPALEGENPQLAQRLIDRAKAVEAAKIPPKVSGLDWITGKFANMVKPVAGVASTVGKYALPPLAGLSAGLDAAEMFHEYEKPEDQRDYAKMALKGASIVGGGLSMFPPAAVVGIPLSLGASAIQAYRESQQEAADRARRRMVGQPMR
jgi:hypothetical protein